MFTPTAILLRVANSYCHMRAVPSKQAVFSLVSMRGDRLRLQVEARVFHYNNNNNNNNKNVGKGLVPNNGRRSWGDWGYVSTKILQRESTKCPFYFQKLPPFVDENIGL